MQKKLELFGKSTHTTTYVKPKFVFRKLLGEKFKVIGSKSDLRSRSYRRSLFGKILDHDLDLIVDRFLTDLDLILRSLFQITFSEQLAFFKHNL